MEWLVILLSLAGGDPTLPVEFRDCRPESEQALAELGVPADDIRGLFSHPRRRVATDGSDRIVGHNVTVRLHSCDGSLNLRFNRNCRLRSSFPLGDCANHSNQ